MITRCRSTKTPTEAAANMSLSIAVVGWLLTLKRESNKSLLSVEERRLRDRRTPRTALRKHHHSPFKFLCDSGNDQALMTCCACTHSVFNEMLTAFEPHFKRCTFDRNGTTRKIKVTRTGKLKGRPGESDAIGCLGLVMCWCRTKGSCARSSSFAFGQTSSPPCYWLKFGRRVLSFSMQTHPNAEVRVPTNCTPKPCQMSIQH